MALPTPFAQTFFVDAATNPDGVFVHSIDVCFAFKDDSLPITMQLRPVVDGYPSPSQIYHNGQCTLFPDVIPCSDGADVLPSLYNNTATRFAFDAPVYLAPGEHALVFASGSTQYFLYMAKIQDPILGGDRAFSSQPYIGSMFRAQNSDAWSPYLNQSLMFKVNRCSFNNSTPSTVEFDNIAPLPTANVKMDSFLVSVNDVILGKTDAEYTYKSTDAGTGALSPTVTDFQVNQNIFPSLRQVLTVSNSAFKVYTTMSSTTDKVSPILDPTRINIIGVENIINNGQLENSVAQVTSTGLYQFAGGTGNVAITFSSPDAAGGITATAIGVVTNNLMSNVYFTEHGTGYFTTPTATVAVAVPTPTSNATVSAAGETGTIGGNAKVRYMTRKVVLGDGFDARDLQVFLTANRQPGTEVTVYYKVLSTQDPDQNFANKSWVRMTLASSKTTYSQTALDTVSYKFMSPAGSAIPPTNITYTNAGGTFTTFKYFAIKICLWSTTSTVVPWIQDMRAIALA